MAQHPFIKSVRSSGHVTTEVKKVGVNADLLAQRDELLELAKLLERSLVYEIGKSEKEGDDEGARLKSMTLFMARAAIARATGEQS